MKQTLIVQRDAAILREMAHEVPTEDISSPRIKSIIKAMQTALHGEDDGVAIAAPQIGESLRIFVVSGEIINTINARKRNKNVLAKDAPPEKILTKDLVFINPTLVKLSKTKKNMEEGCLSVRWLYGQVLRSEKATVKALDEKGAKFEMGASGLLAQIFQHEVDHLNGILFTDSATDLEEMPPEKHHEE